MISHSGEWMGKAEAVAATGVPVALNAAAAPVVASGQGSFAEVMRQDEMSHVGTSSEQASVGVEIAAAVTSPPVGVVLSPKSAGVVGPSVVASAVVLKQSVIGGVATVMLPQEMGEAVEVVKTGHGAGSVGKGLAVVDNKGGVDVSAVAVSEQAKDVVPQMLVEKAVALPVVVSKGSAGVGDASVSAKPVVAVAKLVKHSVQVAVPVLVDGHAAVAQSVSAANAVESLQPLVAPVVVASASSVASVSSQETKVGAEDKGVGANGTQSVGAVADVAVGKAVTPEAVASGVGATVSGSAVTASGEVGVAVASGMEKIGGLGLPVTVSAIPMVSDGGVRRVHEGVSVSSGGQQSHGAKELTLQTYEGSSPNRLEVGLQGGAFGWLKVRAELGTNGEVNAYLRGASSGTAELQVQAPKIEAYLGAQAVVVKSVQVETLQQGAGLSAGVGGMGDGAASGSGSQQQGRSGGRQSGYEGSVEWLEQAGDSLVLPPSAAGVLFTGNGSWLSVRA